VGDARLGARWVVGVMGQAVKERRELTADDAPNKIGFVPSLGQPIY